MPPAGGIHTIKTSPEVIRSAVMLYVRFPLSLRNVEDLLHERGIEVSHETMRFLWRMARLAPVSRGRYPREGSTPVSSAPPLLS